MFSWTDTGTPGPAGPEGPAGPAGPQGPAGGVSGISVYLMWPTTVFEDPWGHQRIWAWRVVDGSIYAACERQTDVAISPAYNLAGTGVTLRLSAPATIYPGGAPNEWLYLAYIDNDKTAVFGVVCLRVSR